MPESLKSVCVCAFVWMEDTQCERASEGEMTMPHAMFQYLMRQQRSCVVPLVVLLCKLTHWPFCLPLFEPSQKDVQSSNPSCALKIDLFSGSDHFQSSSCAYDLTAPVDNLDCTGRLD